MVFREIFFNYYFCTVEYNDNVLHDGVDYIEVEEGQEIFIGESEVSLPLFLFSNN